MFNIRTISSKPVFMEKLLTVKDVSMVFQMSPKTIRHWAQIGYIPHYKYRKEIRFNGVELQRWSLRKKIKGRSKYTLEV